MKSVQESGQSSQSYFSLLKAFGTSAASGVYNATTATLYAPITIGSYAYAYLWPDVKTQLINLLKEAHVETPDKIIQKYFDPLPDYLKVAIAKALSKNDKEMNAYVGALFCEFNKSDYLKFQDKKCDSDDQKVAIGDDNFTQKNNLSTYQKFKELEKLPQNPNSTVSFKETQVAELIMYKLGYISIDERKVWRNYVSLTQTRCAVTLIIEELITFKQIKKFEEDAKRSVLNQSALDLLSQVPQDANRNEFIENLIKAIAAQLITFQEAYENGVITVDKLNQFCTNLMEVKKELISEAKERKRNNQTDFDLAKAKLFQQLFTSLEQVQDEEVIKKTITDELQTFKKVWPLFEKEIDEAFLDFSESILFKDEVIDPHHKHTKDKFYLQKPLKNVLKFVLNSVKSTYTEKTGGIESDEPETTLTFIQRS